MKNVRFLSRWLIVFAVIMGFALPASAAPIVIKISHATSLKSTKGQTWEFFKKLAEKRLKGKVEVRHHHSHQLYGQRQGIQALQAGAIQLISPGTALMTGEYPKFALFALPYMFKTPEVLRKLAKSPEVGGKIFSEMPQKGLKFLAFWLNGYRFLGNSKRLVKRLEDLKGIKVRVPGGKIYRDTFKALGANVVSVSWKEIVTALQTKMVDGIEPTASNWEAQKLYELAPYITFTNHMLSTYVVATNQKWWDGLPAGVRKELAQVMKETTKFNWDMVQRVNREAIEKMKATGKAQFHTLSDKERVRWVDRMRPIYKRYEKIVGKDIMNAVYKIVK
jgi:C4-dicarboxylate-binding protein DctP